MAQEVLGSSIGDRMKAKLQTELIQSLSFTQRRAKCEFRLSTPTNSKTLRQLILKAASLAVLSDVVYRKSREYEQENQRETDSDRCHRVEHRPQLSEAFWRTEQCPIEPACDQLSARACVCVRSSVCYSGSTVCRLTSRCCEWEISGAPVLRSSRNRLSATSESALCPNARST